MIKDFYLKDNLEITVIGDAMLDKYIIGSSDRISPEAPVPVVKVNDEIYKPGGAANVALNLSSLGSNTTLIGVTGKDASSTAVIDLLKKNNIKKALSKSDHPTISKTRILASQQQLIRIDNEEEFSETDWQSSLSHYKKHISFKKNKVLIISDYGKGTLKNIPLIIREAKKTKKTILVDPKGDDFEKYKSADIITPNLYEFERVVGKISSESEITKKGKDLIKSLRLNSLLITRGSDGMTLLDKRNGKVIREDFPTEARDVFDVSGAGDTVIASIAAGLAGGFSLSESIRLANIAAGIVVGKSGTATVNQAELVPYLGLSESYVTSSEIKAYSQDLHERDKKIVFTNGCFDILHAGHVEYLTAAKEMGDKLIVAINTDRSVRKLKGSSRPINTLAHRAKVLASLQCVDKVVFFDEETPINLIKTIKPDVLVKGGDYKIKDIVGYKEVTKSGGSVVTIPLFEGLSTSKIIAKTL